MPITPPKPNGYQINEIPFKINTTDTTSPDDTKKERKKKKKKKKKKLLDDKANDENGKLLKKKKKKKLRDSNKEQPNIDDNTQEDRNGLKRKCSFDNADTNGIT